MAHFELMARWHTKIHSVGMARSFLTGTLVYIGSLQFCGYSPTLLARFFNAGTLC